MGAGPSNLYIYLGLKDGQDKYEDEYTVDISREICKPCTNFEKVSYKINYNKEKKTGIWTYFAYYSVTLYSGTNYNNLGNYGFCYYYPGEEDILQGVDVYYTMMRPDLPIIVTFRTRKRKEYNCSYELLRQAEWDYPTNLGKYAIDGKVSDNLSPEFRKLLKSLFFFSSSRFNKDVEQVPKHPEIRSKRNYINSKKNFHHVGFTSNCNKMHAKLYTDRWFWSKKESTMTGLEKIINKLFDGIQVFYSGTEPLLIECLTGCSEKIQHVRKGKGTDFCLAKVEYKDYNELESRLEELKRDFESDRASTFCISEQSTTSSSLTGSGSSVNGASGTQDSSSGKKTEPKPREGGQQLEKKPAEKKEDEKDNTGKEKHKDVKLSSTPPSSGHDHEDHSKSKETEQPSHAQHTGHGDKKRTHPNGESRRTPEQPTKEKTTPQKQEQDQTVTSAGTHSHHSGGDSSKPGSQVTHQGHSHGDSGKTSHNRATHTSTVSTSHTHTPESPQTSGATESPNGGDGPHTSEPLQQQSKQTDDDDGSCAPIIALGTIAGVILTGTVVGAVGNFVHQCLSLIRWLT
ncbi:hypothetical protein MACK_002335 [Theileria orientalis]|uniref:Uncharacterized protein n=1 Tax=Theileria orientalis TaxID=68886 RepID=A0A976QV89_THEOR|nr:hypothetical protein MACK_002335 [Theileria orientalis]